jgi:hypothetical protein
MVAANTLTVMYGDSGVGKSSLLRARLPSALAELDPGWGVIYFSEWRPGSGAKLAAAVRAELDLPERIEIGELSRSLLRAAKSNDTPTLLILDQFEEFFVYAASAEYEAIQSEIAKLANRTGWAVKVLLSIRNDGLFLLDKMKIRVPQIYSVLFRLDPLTAATARLCITAPIVEYNRETGATITVPEANSELVDVLVAGARRGVLRKRLGKRGKDEDMEEVATDEIVVAFLQLAIDRLWTECVINNKKNALDLDTLNRLAGLRPRTRAEALHAVGLVVQKSVDSALDRYTPGQKKICRTILDKMVLPSGQKVSIRLRDLEPYLRKGTEAAAENLLNDLSSRGAGLVKVVAPPAGEEEVVYQIVHDAMGIPILDWVRRREAEEKIRRGNLRRTWALVGLFFVMIIGLGFFSIVKYTALKNEVKRLVAVAENTAATSNRASLLMLLSAAHDANSDLLAYVSALDKGPVLDALRARLSDSPRAGGSYSAVAFDAKSARLAWIPAGAPDSDRLYICSLSRGFNCDGTDENKQQKSCRNSRRRCGIKRASVPPCGAALRPSWAL